MTNSRTLILGLESSCDETAAAIVADGRDVLASVVASQIKLHEKYGGVVPELAARAHLEKIIPVVRETFERAAIDPADITAVAVSHCPGLTPALIIAITAAKTLAWVWSKPLLAVNHVHSHLQSVMLEQDRHCFPAVALIVSGGHTSLYHCKDPLDLQLIGRTRDDAAGEAFDKVAMILKLPYPGGPSIEKAARTGNPRAFDFPRTYLEKGSLDFSFSGIKTAILYHCRGQNMLGHDLAAQMSPQEISDIAASFQQAVIDVLVNKTLLAAEQTGARTILLGGGVAANTPLRQQLQTRCDENQITLIVAEKKYCTDNAAMIAGLGYYLLKAGRTAPLDLEPRAVAP